MNKEIGSATFRQAVEEERSRHQQEDDRSDGHIHMNRLSRDEELIEKSLVEIEAIVEEMLEAARSDRADDGRRGGTESGAERPDDSPPSDEPSPHATSSKPEEEEVRVEVVDATPPNGTPWSAANCCGRRKP
jgi:hypothetical protein